MIIHFDSSVTSLTVVTTQVRCVYLRGGGGEEGAARKLVNILRRASSNLLTRNLSGIFKADSNPV
jgi:hypothetical protein